MIQATINDNVIEAFLYEKFNGDKKKITNYINEFLHKYLPQNENNKAFEEDRKRFHETYREMKNGTMKMLSEEEANRDIEEFLKKL
jgi:GTP cyclohydrolase I